MKFPRILKGPKSHLVTGSRVFEELLVYWGFSFESLIWIPIVRFGEVLSSLFPVESCGNSMCIALLKMTWKGSWIESQLIRCGAECCSLGCCRMLQWHSEFAPNGCSLVWCWTPVLHADVTELRNSVHGLLAVSAWHSTGEVSSSEEDTSDEARLTGFHCRLRKWRQASGGQVSVWRHLVVPALLSCYSMALASDQCWRSCFTHFLLHT